LDGKLKDPSPKHKKQAQEADSNTNKFMEFAGAWADMPDEDFDDFLREIRLRRSTLWAADIQSMKGIGVAVTEDTLTVELADGRTLSVPLAWYPRLLHGNGTERAHWEWSGDGEGIHWPDLDEDISIEGLILGRRSGESQRSLQHWLDTRPN
jgi:hypothetical protein